MIISQTWQQISTTGAVVQKSGQGFLSLTYFTGAPTGEFDTFNLTHREITLYPTITGKALWARANKDTSITVEPLQ